MKDPYLDIPVSVPLNIKWTKELTEKMFPVGISNKIMNEWMNELCSQNKSRIHKRDDFQIQGNMSAMDWGW